MKIWRGERYNAAGEKKISEYLDYFGLTTGYMAGVVLGMGVASIFIGTATDECIRGIIVMYYWYKKKWLGKSVVDKDFESSKY